jgi:hypothetical protein
MARKFDLQVLMTAVDNVSKDVKGIKQSFNLLNTQVIAVTGAIVGVTAATLKAAKAAGIQQQQEFLLAQAMKTAGTFTESAFKENLKYASALQDLTKYGDENILTVQRLLTNFGIEGEELKGLTKATLDLASAKGMDLKAAGDLVAKSVGSSTNALTRYGIEITGAVGSTQRAQTAIENISNLFGGTAQAEANTYLGAVEQLKNETGDLWEAIGDFLLPILTELAKEMKDVVGKAIEILNNRNIDLTDTAKTLGEAFKKTAEFVFNFGKDLIEVIKFVNDVRKSMTKLIDKISIISKVKSVIKGVTGAFKDLDTAVKDTQTTTTEANNQAIEQTKTRVAAVKEMNDAIANSHLQLMGTELSLFDARKSTLENFTAYRAEQEEVQKNNFFAVLNREMEAQLAWYNKSSALRQGFITATSAGFQTMIKGIGKNWDEFGKGLTQIMGGLKDTIIKSVADIAAQWVVKVGLMKAASLAWAGVVWLANQAIAAARIIAGWATIPIVGAALGIAAAAALISSMGKFKFFADGVRGFAGGNAIVGERGKEMIKIPPGSDVYNNGETRYMLNSMKKPTMSRIVNINIDFANSTFTGTLDEISEAISSQLVNDLRLQANLT